jgi:hypothetical protein
MRRKWRPTVRDSVTGPATITALLLAGNIFSVASARPNSANACIMLKSTLTALRVETVDQKRDALAGRLPQALMVRRSCGTNPNTMDAISILLGDPSDVVRSWAAVTLGLIGPSAARTVPALQARSDAILDADPSPFFPTQYSGQAIREALRQITHQAVPEYNEEPGRNAPVAHPVDPKRE